MKGFVCTALAVALCLSAGQSLATDFDGSKTLLCVPTDNLTCEGAGECHRSTVEELNIPQFIKVDFRAKQLSGKLESDDELNTAVQNIVTADGRTILQGAENGRGWSMVIMHDTGEMSAAIAGDEAAIVMLGACTPR